MPHSNQAPRFIAGLLAAAALLVLQAPARASEPFPGVLQEKLGMPCVPSCIVCHGKTPGDASSFSARQLPKDLVFPPRMLPSPGDTTTLSADIDSYVTQSMTDAKAAAVIASLKSGKDPETGASLCGPTYGCAVHVAKKAPANDVSAPLWVVGAMMLGGFLRRRKAAR